MVAAETIDIGECERLIRQAHADFAAGLPGAAVEGFDAALALWRGAPLADVRPTPLVMAEVARLEETRIATVEARIGAELELGRHGMLLPELKVLVSQHPLRERLHAHLMTALYRDGQQAVALGAYRDLRRLLVDELGIEPSESLARPGTADPAQRSGAAAAPPGGPPACPGGHADPAGLPLPRRPVTLHGRHAELGRLVKGGARPGGRCRPGAGRRRQDRPGGARRATSWPRNTRAGRCSYPWAGETPDGPAEAARAVRVLAEALGLSSPTGDHPASGWSALLTGRRVVVVLDDVATAAQVRVLGPVPVGCALIVTSRSGMTTLDGATRVSVGSLDPDDALDVLRYHLGAERVDRRARGGAHARGALRRAAPGPADRGRPAGDPAELVARRLRRPAGRSRRPARRPGLRVDVDPGLLAGAVRVLARYGDGDGVALRALRLLSRLDRGLVGVSNLAALSGQPMAAAEVAAERLVDAGLAEALPDGRYRIPELVRAHVRELGRSPECDQSWPCAVSIPPLPDRAGEPAVNGTTGGPAAGGSSPGRPSDGPVRRRRSPRSR